MIPLAAEWTCCYRPLQLGGEAGGMVLSFTGAGRKGSVGGLRSERGKCGETRLCSLELLNYADLWNVQDRIIKLLFSMFK